MVHYPQAWTTIFATRKDRRSFVEACLERSQSLPLEVILDAGDEGRVPIVGCNCGRDVLGRLLPNEGSPCELHFVFESLAHPKHSERIQMLNMGSSIAKFHQALGFESCRFFSSLLPQLTTITWKDDWMEDSHHLFPDPRSLPNLHSVTFEGLWRHSLAQLHNLTFFSIEHGIRHLDAEVLRLFVSNNPSLESLELHASVVGSTGGPPVDLLNLKSLSIDSRPKVLSSVIRVPAFQRLSSLQISLEDGIGDLHTLRATGDGISLSAQSWAHDVAEDWEYLTGYARPTIRHVRIYDQQPVDCYPRDDFSTRILALLEDAHTLDIGLSYSWCWGKLWAGLEELGPHLTTIRFEISEAMEPPGRWSDLGPYLVDQILNKIADLVECRFGEGRALSVVERMVVSEDEGVNRLQDRVWRKFCDDQKIGEYLASAL